MRHLVFRTAGICAAIFGVILLAAMVFIGVCIFEAPDFDASNAEPSGYLTTVLDDDENVMITLAGTESNRVYVTLDQIPEQLQEAFIAIEDERFYSHHGIDPKGILRAAWTGITTGHFSQGASTITQQLVKNNVLTSWTDEDGFCDKLVRKIQEQYLAIRLEQQESKEWILENYLNTINLGGGTWGVEAASQKYFGKDVSGLTLSECAVLAGITKSPTAYNPLLNPEKSKERFELVLNAMEKNGYITSAEKEAALADDVYDRIASNHSSDNTEVFSYFEDELVRSVLNDLMEECNYTEEEAWNAIYSGGLTIYSTQDSEIQAAAEEVINEDWYADDSVQASIVITSVTDGSVKAIVGGRGEKEASLVYDRATSALRQPGSTIKIPGEYAAALDTNEITLGTVVSDSAVSYSDGTDVSNASGNYSGNTTVRKAIASSLNTVAVRIFQNTGMSTVWNYLSRFGIDTLTEADQVEALALGGTSGGVTNLEMTAAYNAIAAGGTWTEPYFYTKVLDHNGNVLLEKKPSTSQSISSTTAALLTSAMEDVITSGTGTAAQFSGFPIAGKSGTTSGSRDLWFIGYSPYFTCGVWGGYDDNSEQESTKYVKKIWRAVMEKVHSDYLYKDFSSNDNLVSAEICTKCGKLAIDGLCDSTVQGDMTYTESFVSGTQPTEYCDCHEEVEICTVSGKAAGFYCPSSDRETRVYLKTAVSGTEDEDYVIPSTASETCDQHTTLWDKWFGDGSGYDNGYGSGSDGSDYGYGYGTGNGTGNNGNDGSGYGNGYGTGSNGSNGSGYGNGYGTGSNGSGGSGYGNGYGTASDGSNSGNGTSSDGNGYGSDNNDSTGSSGSNSSGSSGISNFGNWLQW